VKKTPPTYRKTRAPRIRVPDQERALFTIDGSPFVGVLRTLSISGGSAVLSRGPISRGTSGTVAIKTVFGKVSAHVEFLQTCADGIPLAQAFRFVTMDDESLRRLSLASHHMEQEGHSDVLATTNLAGKSSNGIAKLLRSVGQIASNLLPRRIPKK
jgi:hypothetical protein